MCSKRAGRSQSGFDTGYVDREVGGGGLQITYNMSVRMLLAP